MEKKALIIKKNIDIYLKDKAFLNDYNYDKVLLGLDLFYKNEFKVLENSSEKQEFLFGDSLFITFSFNKNEFSITCDENTEDEILVCAFIHLYLERVPLTITGKLLEKYFIIDKNNKNKLISLIIELLGYKKEVINNYSFYKLNNYIDTVFSINTFYLTNIQNDMFYKYVLSFEVNIDDDDFNSLVNNIIAIRPYNNAERALYYLAESVFMMINRIRAFSFYERLKNRVTNNNIKSKFLYYLKIRLQYEYIDTNEGLNNIYNEYYNNSFVNEYYSKILENNNEALPEKLFLKKMNYNVSDLPTIKKYIDNWDYEVKNKVLLNILYDANEKKYYDILNLLNDDDKKRFICDNYYTFSRNKKLLSELLNLYNEDSDFILMIAKKLPIDFLLKKWDLVKENENELYSIVLNYYYNDYECIGLEDTARKILEFNFGNLLCEIFLDVIFSNNRFIDSRRKRVIREMLEKNNRDFSLIRKKIGFNSLNDFVQGVDLEKEYSKVCEKFKKIFKINYSYHINPRGICINIYKDHYNIVSAKIEEELISEYHSSIGEDTDLLNVVLYLIYKNINEIGMDNLKNKFSEMENAEKIHLEEELRKKSKKVLNDLIDIVRKDEISKTSEVVHLEPHLLVSSNYEKQRKLSSFKVGSSKLYVIKNYGDFMYNIINNKVYEYGKAFTFNHNVDSFDEASRKMVDMLLGDSKLTSAYYYGYDNRYVELSETNIDKMFDFYKEVYVTIGTENEKKCFVEEAVELEFCIDKDYNVYCKKTSDDSKITGNIIRGFRCDYLVCEDKIYPLNLKKELREVVAKLVTSGDINISLIKKNFISEIYARFQENFKVSEEIENEFQLKELDIEIYFDYQEGIISYNEKFLINGKEVNAEKINKQIQLARKYSKYQSILSNFGFNDYKLESNELIYNFLRADLSMLKEVALVFLSENIKDVKAKEYNKTNVYMGYNTGLLDVCFEESEYSEEELYKIISSLRKKIRYVKLNNNTIVKVSENEEKKLLGLVEELKLDPHHLKTNQKVPLYQSLKLMSDLDYTGIRVSKNIKDMLNEISDYKNSKFDVPDNFKNVMRYYQIEAYKWIKILSKYSFSGILADDMGLGKSLEIISVIASDEKNMPSLVVCPKSLVYNWDSEFNKWANEIEVYPVIGLSSERHKIMNNYDKDKKQVFLISYDSLKNELEMFNKFNFRYLILDEAQFIKNHTTLKAQSVKKINSELRFVLTGTPIENSVIDLWSIFDFLMPNYLYNYSEFKSNYEKQIIEKDRDTTNRLVKKITPFILRRTKKDVLKDLPEKIEMVRIVEMGESQKKYYDAQLLKTRMMLEGETNKIEILASLTRLRQLCVDPGLFIENYNDTSCKTEAISEIIDEYISEHKIIIFSQFTKAFLSLEKMFKERNIHFAKITGETTAFERITIANDFNDTDKYQVVLVSLKAGGTGLNLIGADIVVHLDPWWNVAAENQASDRAHRIGQKNVVQIIKIICKDSIEQKVIELQNVKKDIVDSLISNDDSAIQKLSTDDLKYLLK